MASFVANGDPGCNNKNWLTKAPTAVGPSGDPATFNPTKLATDQWARVYADAGVKGAVVTAKHGCGHLLWPTKVTLDSGAPYTYCVGKKDSAIKQDVLALFSASMTKANITHVRPPQALAEALAEAQAQARAQPLLTTASTKLLLLTGLLLLVYK